jgi:hypothetical protein
MHVSDVATTTSEIPTIIIQAFESVPKSPCPQALAIGVVNKVHMA